MDKTKVKPKTEQQELKEFWGKYQILCDEYQAQILVTPAWRATNHGSYELVQQTSVGKMPKKPKI